MTRLLAILSLLIGAALSPRAYGALVGPSPDNPTSIGPSTNTAPAPSTPDESKSNGPTKKLPAKKKKAKKRHKKAKAEVNDETAATDDVNSGKPQKPPSQLPKYKRKTKIIVDFENSPAQEVVVRPQPTSLEQAEKQAEQDQAAMDVRSRPDRPSPALPTAPITDVDKNFSQPTLNAAAAGSSPPQAKVSVSRDFDLNYRPAPKAANRSEIPYAATPTPAPATVRQPLPPPAASSLPPAVVTQPTPVSKSMPPAAVSRPTPPAAASSQDSEESILVYPDDEPWITRLNILGSYLDAPYSQINSYLENDATGFGLGVSRSRGPFEERVSFQVAQGLDQAVTVQNTRFWSLRADSEYLFFNTAVTPLAGLGIGYGNFNVFSYHTINGGATTEFIENEQSSALILTPTIGVRFRLPEHWTIDLSAEYLTVIGAPNSSALGGLTGAFNLGVPF